MEESQNLMWLKRKQILNSNIQVPFGVCYNNNSNNSWEERAFAEDAARILGGCIWPPRSYSCNFCKREFRSAQALGGHMNVHRRDRARLRSSLSSYVSECPKPNPSIIKGSNTNNNSTHLSPSSSQSYISDALLNCSHPSSLYCPCLTLSSSTCGDKKPRLASSHSPLSPQIKEIMVKGCDMGDEIKVFNNNNEHNITLELGIGLFQHPKETLDLELRLGNF